MKILFFTQHFSLPSEPGLSRSYQFTKKWAEDRNNITVVTSAYNYHLSGVPEKYSKRFISTETIGAIKIIRIRIKGYCFKKWILFALAATFVSLFLRKRDIIFASSKPLTTGIPALIMSLLWQRPFMLEVRDLYNKNGRYADFFARLEKILYNYAKKIVGVSRGICEDVIKKGKPLKDVIYIPHGADDWILTERKPRENYIMPTDKFNCILAASIRKNSEVDFEVFMKTAELLRDKPDIHFYVIGDGNLLEELKSKKLENVTFLGVLSKIDAIDIVKSADVCILPHVEKLRGQDNYDWPTPAKLFDYLGCAKPIVATGSKTTRDIINGAKAGITVEEKDAESFAEAVLKIKSFNVQERIAMGKRGYEYVYRHHNLIFLADRLEENMASL